MRATFRQKTGLNPLSQCQLLLHPLLLGRFLEQKVILYGDGSLACDATQDVCPTLYEALA
jgi:hypothetical protein